MATIAVGSLATYTANIKGATITVSTNGGTCASVSGAASASLGPQQTRQTFGPLEIGQSVTVSVLSGDSAIVEFGDADPGAFGAFDPSSVSGGGSGNVAGDTHAATSKTTPVDGDEIPLADSAASFALKKVTWLNLKAALKTYFDTLYTGGGGPANTDALTEGSTNLYFTAARVRAAVLTGIDVVTSAVVSASDSVMSAIGKLQAQITGLSNTKADYKAIRDETASFTFSATNHANRLTDYNSASAGNATFNTGHGCSPGDTGSFVQYSSGALTLVAGTATVTLGSGINSAVTTGVGSTIDWVYKGSDVFLITNVSKIVAPVAVSGGKTLAIADNGVPQFTSTTSRAFTVPPSMPADYAVPIYGPCTFVDGAGVTATANDYRVAGATLGKEFCLLQQTPTANTYFITGSKV